MPYKTCPQCGKENGVRTLQCKDQSCNHEFKSAQITKKVKQEKEVLDWRSLDRGEYIKTVAGSGPFFLCNDNERESMGYYGAFQIKDVQDDGLLCFPIDKRNSGWCFVYMGPDKVSMAGTKMRSHRLKKLSPKVVERYKRYSA